MASVCGGVLALMDAGVPIKTPVAGISVGLVTEFEGDNSEAMARAKQIFNGMSKTRRHTAGRQNTNTPRHHPFRCQHHPVTPKRRFP